MSINSAWDAKKFEELKSGKATSSQVKTTTAPKREVTPITGGLAVPSTHTTTYTTVVNPEEYAASQKKNESLWSRFCNGAVSLLKSVFGAEYTVIAEADISPDYLINSSIAKVEFVSKDSEVLTQVGDSSKPISVYCQTLKDGGFTDSSVGLKFNIFGFGVDISLGLKNIGINLSHTDDNNTSYFGYSASLYDLDVSCNAGNTVAITDKNSYTVGGKASINGPLLFGAYAYSQEIPYGPYQYPAIPIR